MRDERFKGTISSVCERCCGDDSCTCDQPDDVYPHWLRDHDDCTPYVARNPDEIPEILMTRDLLGTDDHFNACADPENIRSQMDWQNCIEFEQFSCFLYLGGVDCEQTLQAIGDVLPPILNLVGSKFKEVVCEPCRLTGFYFDKGTYAQQPRKQLRTIHTAACDAARRLTNTIPPPLYRWCQA